MLGKWWDSFALFLCWSEVGEYSCLAVADQARTDTFVCVLDHYTVLIPYTNALRLLKCCIFSFTNTRKVKDGENKTLHLSEFRAVVTTWKQADFSCMKWKLKKNKFHWSLKFSITFFSLFPLPLNMQIRCWNPPAETCITNCKLVA